jgi:hypothetical protein
MSPHPLIGVIVEGRWQAGIGDPTLLGWLTVAAYLAASLVCGRAAAAVVVGDHPRRGRPAVFWSVLSLILFFLGVNKQLDLQSALTELGRDLAQEQGWYDQRQGVQVLFIVLIAALGSAALGAIAWTAGGVRGAARERLLALMGLVFLLAFVVVRASSFHNIDRLLGVQLGGVRLNGILELGGIGCVGVAALWSARAPSPRTTPQDDAERARMRALVREVWKL